MDGNRQDTSIQLQQATQQPASVRARVWLQGRHFSSRPGPYCWLWLARPDGRVHALQLPQQVHGCDALLPRLLASVAADPEAAFEVAGVGTVHPLPHAPVVPLPRWQVSWGHPVQQAIRAFAAALDDELLATLGYLEIAGAYVGCAANYNRLAGLPLTRRRHRQQALAQFPLLVAPLLLDGIPRARVFVDRDQEPPLWRARYAPNDSAPMLRAMDAGRDLISALAAYWHTDRALVRAPLLRQPWARMALPERALRLLAAMPAHARPHHREAVESRLGDLEQLPVKLASDADYARLARGFAQGWEARWSSLEGGAPSLGSRLRDSRDFLRSALLQRGLPQLPAWLDEGTLGLAWLARRGLPSLLRASRRWHQQPRDPVAVDDDLPDHIAPVFGEYADDVGTAREITTRAALVEEGDAMAHCVADYWRGCLLRQIRIVHLQLADGDTEGEQATAQFDPVQDAAEAGYCLAELRGRFNQDSSAAMEAFAERLLARINDDRHLARRRRVRDEAEQHRRAFGSVERRGNTQRLDRRSRTELRQVLEYCLKQPDWQARPEILYQGPVVGFAYAHGPDLLPRLAAGDRLQLVREPDNPHDAHAVRIDWRGHKLGYLPRSANGDIARRLDAGMILHTTITAIDDAHDYAPVTCVVDTSP